MVPGVKPESRDEIHEAKAFNKKKSKMQTGEIIREEVKESFPMELGTYKATLVPLFVLFFGWKCQVSATTGMQADPRMAGLPFMENCFTILALTILYIMFSVVWGPNFMKNREPFKIRKIMAFYNAFQVVFCAYMVIEVGRVAWWFDYSFYCQPVDYSWNEKPLRMTKVAYCFFLSKILDFCDTLFFVLNKKFSHISVLHVVHHSTMTVSMWAGIRFTAGGHLTFLGYVNGMVHVIMYSYYFLAALGPKFRPYLWWKKYLTTIQLAQFVLVFIHSAQLLFHECPTIPIGLIHWVCVYAVIFFYLFADFYNKEYSGKGKKKLENGQPTPDSNGVSNGHLKSSQNISNLTSDSCLRERQTNLVE